MAKASKPEAQKSGHTIIFLEYCRIYAFMAVFISHKFPQWAHIQLIGHSDAERLISMIYNAFMPSLTNGQGGVIMFFFISGYIIANKVDEEPTLVFLIKRLFRIYPLYIACVLASQYLSLGHLQPWSQLWPKFTLMGDFTHTDFGLGVEWTLRIEVTFYLFAAALTLLPKFKYRYPLLTLLITIATIICALMPPFPDWNPYTLGYFNQFFPFLMAGMGLYYFDIGKTPILAVTPIILIALSEMYAMAMPLLMFFAFFAAMTQRRHLPNWQWAKHISCITYGFYMIHLWLWDYLLPRFLSRGLSLGKSEALTFVCLLLVCYTAHYSIEKPGISIGRRLAKTMGRRGQAALTLLWARLAG